MARTGGRRAIGSANSPYFCKSIANSRAFRAWISDIFLEQRRKPWRDGSASDALGCRQCGDVGGYEFGVSTGLVSVLLQSGITGTAYAYLRVALP